MLQERAELSVAEIRAKFNADYVGPAYHGYRVVTSKGKSWVVDKFGNIGNAQAFKYISEPCEGFRMACLKNWRWRYLYHDGRLAFHGMIFDTVTNFHNGLAKVEVKRNPRDFRGDFFYIDRNGNNPFPKYSSVGAFVHGLAVAINLNGRSLFIETSGYPIMKGATFPAAWPFEGNLAQVMRDDGNLAFVSREGAIIS